MEFIGYNVLTCGEPSRLKVYNVRTLNALSLMLVSLPGVYPVASMHLLLWKLFGDLEFWLLCWRMYPLSEIYDGPDSRDESSLNLPHTVTWVTSSTCFSVPRALIGNDFAVRFPIESRSEIQSRNLNFHYSNTKCRALWIICSRNSKSDFGFWSL